MPDWPKEAKLTQEQVQTIVAGLFERYLDGDASQEGDPLHRPTKLINRIMWNRAHLHALPQADPVIPEPYHEGLKFQTDRPRQLWAQLKARLIENPLTITATTLSGRSNGASDSLEKVIQYGIEETESRTGVNIMGSLADGLITLCYGVLHWRRAEEFYPHKLERRYANAVSQDEADDWEATPLDDVERGVFREKAKAYDARRKDERARIGFPYHIEVLHPSTVLRLPDTSLAAGDAMDLHIRKMLVLDYDQKLQEQDGLRLSINEADSTLAIYREQDAPPDGRAYQNSEEVIIANLWTRDECYEIAIAGRSVDPRMAQWQFVKHFKHEWCHPPFAFPAGFEMLDPDPVMRFQPALEGVYRLKPGYDRLLSLWMVIAEMTAVPVWYLEDTKTGVPKLTEDGRILTFSRNSAMAEKLPEGTTLKKMEWTQRPEFLTAIEMFAEEMRKAEPSTGLASFTASTQPWTARMEMQQQSIQPKQLLLNMVKAVRRMTEDIKDDIGRRDEAVTAMIPTKDRSGTVRGGEVVEVTPEQARTLRVYANVDSVSAAERYSKIEMGRQLRADPLVKLSWREFVEEYEGRPDATQVMMERDIEQFFEQYEKPMLMQRMVRARLGTDVTFSPGTQSFMGSDGQELSPAQVMQKKTGMGAGATGASREGGMRNPGMPEMADLRAPNTVPLEGQR